MSNLLSPEKTALLHRLADTYETASFINGDPSYFMHQVKGGLNQEAMAWMTSVLSYGNRKQFMPRIQQLLNLSDGEPYQWICNGRYKEVFPNDDSCFYRLHSHHAFTLFLQATQKLFNEFGSLKNYIRVSKACTGLEAVSLLCQWYHMYKLDGLVPKNTTSCCKRVCMMMRWMVRDGSPVDLGLWNGLVDKRTLIIPMDTHVVSTAIKLGLIMSKSATMSAAIRLTKVLREAFPTDPLKADFALFGAGTARELE